MEAMQGVPTPPPREKPTKLGLKYQHFTVAGPKLIFQLQKCSKPTPAPKNIISLPTVTRYLLSLPCPNHKTSKHR